MYLYGKNSVLERLLVNPKSIKKVFLRENFSVERVLGLIKAAGIPSARVTEKALNKIKNADRLQGIVAQVDNFAYADFDGLLHGGLDKNLSFICVDNINDPHNLGSILRTAACFGGFAVVIPRHGSCEVTDAVMHVASGGENFVPVAKVNNLSNALIKAKRVGYWIVGTVVESGTNIGKVSFPFPLCLVLGSEGKGIRHGIEKRLELKVRLPMKGAALSFNVAMACAIFCHEINRQKEK